MALLEVNGTRLRVEESGSGEPLVLVHGSWDGVEAWELVVEDLARSFRVVAYDRRGHGGSEEGSGSGTRRDDEDDLAALIETLDLAPAHVVANSFGGSASLGLVARRPEVFRSLCVHEPPLIGLAADHPAVQQTAARVRPLLELIEQGRHEEAARSFVDEVAIGEGVWEIMRPADRERMTRNAPTFLGENRDPSGFTLDLDSLRSLDVPVLLTQGDRSPAFYAPIIAQIAEAIPGARVRTLPGDGHVPHLTHPREYVELVTGFACDVAGSAR